MFNAKRGLPNFKLVPMSSYGLKHITIDTRTFADWMKSLKLDPEWSKTFWISKPRKKAHQIWVYDIDQLSLCVSLNE